MAQEGLHNFLDIRDKSNHLIITTYGERIFASIYCGGVPKTILFLDYKSKWEEEAVFWSTVVNSIPLNECERFSPDSENLYPVSCIA